MRSPDPRIPQYVVESILAEPGPYPPSWAVAQWVLETDWGKSRVWLSGRNGFGLKPAKKLKAAIELRSGTMRDGKVEYATFGTFASCVRARAVTLESYGVTDVRKAMGIWCPKPGYVEDLDKLRRQWHGLDAEWLREGIGMDELKMVLGAMTGWSTGQYAWIVELVLAVPQWIMEAERTAASGPDKMKYVTSRVYAAVDEALNIPWFLDNLVEKKVVERLTSWIVGRLNSVHGRDWGAGEPPF